MAHVGEEIALCPVRGFSRFLRLLQLCGTLSYRPFQTAGNRLDGRLALRNPPHFPDRSRAELDQNDVLEDNPPGMLDPPPRTRRDQPKHGLGVQYAPHRMISCNHQGRRNQYAPVAIIGKEGERAEHVEVRFDPAPAQVDQQRGHEHLPACDNMPGQGFGWPGNRQQYRQGRDRTAQEDSQPHMNVDPAGGSDPCAGREPHGGGYGDDPLHRHQNGKQVAGLPFDVALMLRHQLARVRRTIVASRPGLQHCCHLFPFHQRAAKHRRLTVSGLPPQQQRLNVCLAIIVAVVTPRGGNPAIEYEAPAGIKQQYLAGCAGPKAPGLSSPDVCEHPDTGDRRCTAPQFSRHPVAGIRRRQVEEYSGFNFLSTTGDYLREFLNRGAGAWTLGVGEEDQCGSLTSRLNACSRRPSFHRGCRAARSVSVLKQDRNAEAHRGHP
jgi:hypothetical protein